MLEEEQADKENVFEVVWGLVCGGTGQRGMVEDRVVDEVDVFKSEPREKDKCCGKKGKAY